MCASARRWASRCCTRGRTGSPARVSRSRGARSRSAPARRGSTSRACRCTACWPRRPAGGGRGRLAAAPGWEVARHEAGTLAARFDFAAHRELFSAFPFAHELELEATVRDTTLTIVSRVRATGDAPVPIACGFHAYLRLPGIERGDCRVEIPVGEHLRLDERNLP